METKYTYKDILTGRQRFTRAKFEAMAAADPDHDWRCLLFAPLRGREYQRHDADKWVLIASNQGFA